MRSPISPWLTHTFDNYSGDRSFCRRKTTPPSALGMQRSPQKSEPRDSTGNWASSGQALGTAGKPGPLSEPLGFLQEGPDATCQWVTAPRCPGDTQALLWRMKQPELHWAFEESAEALPRTPLSSGQGTSVCAK